MKASPKEIQYANEMPTVDDERASALVETNIGRGKFLTVVRDEYEAQEAPAMSRAGDLGAIDGDDTGEGTNAETGQNAGAEDPVRGLRGGLQCTSRRGKNGRAHNAVDAAEAVGNPTAHEATDDAAEVWCAGRVSVRGSAQE